MQTYRYRKALEVNGFKMGLFFGSVISSGKSLFRGNTLLGAKRRIRALTWLTLTMRDLLDIFSLEH